MPDEYLKVRAERQQRQRARWAKVTGRLKDAAAVIAALTLIALLVGAGIGYLTRKPEPKSDQEIIRELGEQMARQVLEDELLSPSTTVYLNDSVQVGPEITYMGLTAWVVQGAIDAPNEYGVPVRRQWSTVVVLDEDAGDIARTTDVYLDERLLWSDPKLTEIVERNRKPEEQKAL